MGADHQVFRAMQTVQFEHKCADEVPHQVQACAELKSEDGRARALALLYARRESVRREILLGARLVAMRLEAGRDNGGMKWAVGMEARTAAARHIGERHTHYICCPTRGEGVRRAFRTDRTGVLDWLDYAEPFGGNGRGGFPCNWSPRMETTAAALRMSPESPHVALGLVLTEVESGHTIRLSGPDMTVPDRIWREPPPKLAIRGWFASFNPFARGGLLWTLARAARYRECVRARRSAKREFVAK